jgi:hypothetical protein
LFEAFITFGATLVEQVKSNLFGEYCQNWLNLRTDDHHYSYKQKFPKKKKKKKALLLPKDTRWEKIQKKI